MMGLSTKGPITPYQGSWAHRRECERAGVDEAMKRPADELPARPKLRLKL